MFSFPPLFEREKRLPLPSNRRGKVDASEHPMTGKEMTNTKRHFTPVHIIIDCTRMKRFLTVEKEEEDNTETNTIKKAKIKRKYPSTFLTVNVNGLLSKINSSDKWKEKHALLSYLRSANADVISITETWIPGNGSSGSSSKKCTQPYSNDGTNKSYRESANGIESLLDSNGFLRKYARYYNCFHQKSAGVLTLVNAEEVEKPSRVRLRFTNEDKGEEEWPGRVIECQFGDDEDANRLVVLSTYSPNNGSGAESRERRRRWDDSVLKRLTQLRKEGVDFIWNGDLNVAPDGIDVKFDDIEAVKNRKASDPDYGVAGFTRNEQRRFRNILEASEASDAYRVVNGERRSYTWRAYTVNKVGGKVFNTVNPGMRLDLMVVSKNLKSKIQRCYHATDDLPDTEAMKMPMEKFFGSDHCAVHLELKNMDNDNNNNNSEENEENEKETNATKEKDASDPSDRGLRSIEAIE